MFPDEETETEDQLVPIVEGENGDMERERLWIV